jgi:hypothetical protein
MDFEIERSERETRDGCTLHSTVKRRWTFGLCAFV